VPRSRPISVRALAAALRGRLSGAEIELLERVEATDWSRESLDLADGADRAFAAGAAALGAAVFYSFGNFCALAAHPALASLRRVNLFKGRPRGQVGSVTTTPERFDGLFDWTRLPAGLSPARVRSIMDDFFALGPFGFRGPAAAAIPDHLAALDAGVRTTQLIAPGARCPSRLLLAEALGLIEHDFLFITSANVSSRVTGSVEPAHYDLRGIQADFGAADGVVLIGHRDEAAVRASYPRHLPMSTSIVAFHKLGRDETGRPALVLERHGSLHVAHVKAIADRYGLGLVLDPGALARLPMRERAAAAA
jgi:hypothetical protein